MASLALILLSGSYSSNFESKSIPLCVKFVNFSRILFFDSTENLNSLAFGRSLNPGHFFSSGVPSIENIYLHMFKFKASINRCIRYIAL
ncbi:hypothetical protein AX774_g3297 [Zancudomyces culisetae]|uniref:Uncharacterized protein n=1 Tax=Zancudomyces culisetae TaxID=1213189 RepID=A0A1R1PQI2_ZANCU|nr:hypothetical protein AX774_g3297 [Zancudomyces culisetae]|eukprot:OMH83201.1 hypothetical protein AX774_g3297 [Zancudomyces culisetae]